MNKQDLFWGTPRRVFLLGLGLVCIVSFTLPFARSRAVGPSLPDAQAIKIEDDYVNAFQEASGRTAAVLLFAPRPLTAGTCDAFPTGNIEVQGTGGTAATQPFAYGTLAAAFAAINAGGHTGTITIDVCGDTTETSSSVLFASGTGSSSYTTITMSPAGGAARTISGNIAGALVSLSGADNVTTDGLNTGGNSLTFDNTATGLVSTISFINDATGNIVQNCSIRGAGTATTVGTITFGTSAGNGNDNNTITNNVITSSGGNLPTNAIYSLGVSAALANNGIIISSNQISDYFNASAVSMGINVAGTGNSGWTISNNKLFQTALRLDTTGNTHRGISIGTGSGYTISGNTIGFANAGGTGKTMLVGNSVALSGTFPSAWNIAGTPNPTRFIGVSAAFTTGGAVSEIQGNTIAGFALYTSSGATTSNGIWAGINVASGNVNIGTTTGNTIGATTGQGSVYTATNTAGGTVVGIFVDSINTVMIQNNTIGAIDSAGDVVASGCGGLTGISVAGSGVFTISGNSIGNATANNLRVGNLATGATLSNTGSFVTTTGTGFAVGIASTASGTALNITNNTLRGFAMSTTASSPNSVFNGIRSSGDVTGAVNLNNNFLGTAATGLLTYAFAIGATSALTGINCSNAFPASTISISNNDLRGIVHSVTGANAHAYISWLHNGAGTDNINGNTFTNLNVNTSGSVTFLSRLQTGIMTATGIENANSNAIVTAFTKSGAGSYVTFYTADGTSVAGSTMTQTLNNFSNINIVGDTVIYGWLNREGAPSGNAPVKTITNNTFSNITATATPTGEITLMEVDQSANGSVVSGNTISNVTGGTTITGLKLGSANAATITATQNGINTFTATGPGVVTGILTQAPGVSLTKNKIYGLGGTHSGDTVTGILQNCTTAFSTATIANNLIGSLTAAGSTFPNGIIGISITGAAASSTNNIFFNTIYLNNPTSGAGFGSSGISTVASSTVTTSALNLRNNIVVNTSVQNGAGLTVAYRRSAGAANNLNNYATASNNNLFYAGTPSATNLIYSDGVSSAQTLAAYRNGVFTAGTIGPRDSGSVSENPPFLSTTGSNANFLHINPAIATQVESAGGTGTGISDDFDGQARSVTVPDVGADEFAGILNDMTGPVISYALLGNGANVGTRTFSNVTITDATGVNVTAGTRPRVYFKKTSDANNTFNGNTSATVGWKFVEATGAGGSPFTFTVDYSKLFGGAGVSIGDVIQYFVVAQDTHAPTPNMGINAGSFAATPTSVALTATAFPIGGTINSYTIAAAIPATITVDAGGAIPSITNPGGLFATLNSGVLTGNVTVNITSDLTAETGAIILNQLVEDPVGNFTVTIKASGSARLISGSSSNGLITLNGADRIVFDGTSTSIPPPDEGDRSGLAPEAVDNNLTINNTNAGASSAVIWVQTATGGNGATNNTFRKLNINGNASNQTLFGIGFGGTTISVSSLGSGNNNNRVEGCDIRRLQRGIYTQGASAAAKNTGNVIAQNILTAASPNNIGRSGIMAGFEDGIQVTQNAVSGISSNAASTDAMGITLGFVGANPIVNSATSGNEVVNAIVSRNVIGTITHTSNESSCGICIAATTSGTTQIDHNVITGVAGTGTFDNFFAGMFLGGGIGSTTKIYFNSISMSGTSGGIASVERSYGLAINGNDPVVDIRNNIFYNTQVITSSFQAVHNIGLGYSTFNNLTSNYNNFFNTTGALFALGRTGGLDDIGTDTVTLADWIAATGQDTPNSIAGNPLFTSATDLHIVTGTGYAAPPPGSNAGTMIAGFTLDADGNARGATPDIGAYEFAVNRTLNVNGTLPGGNYDSILVTGNTTVATLAGQVNIGAGSVSVDGGAMLTGCFNVIGGAGSTFTLNDQGSLGICHAAGITTSGATGMIQTATRSFNTGANYVYNGTTAQLTGNGLPATVRNLTINNPGNTVTSIVPGLSVTETLDVIAGTWLSSTSYKDVLIEPAGALAAGAEDIQVSGDWTNNGIFTPNSRTVIFNGASAQSIGGSGVNTFDGMTMINTAGLTLLTGNIRINGTLTMTQGTINAAANSVIIGISGTVSRSAGSIIGKEQKLYPAGAGQSFTYDIGTANGYSPVEVTNLTAGTAGDSLTVSAVQKYYGFAGETPALDPNSLQRYWDLTKTGTITANLKFHFMPGDVIGGGTGYRIVRINPPAAIGFTNALDCPGNSTASPCVNVPGGYMYVQNISSFSKWTAGPALAPTAAGADLGGRIVDANGRPISNALVVLTGAGLTEPMIAQTGQLGYFNFSGLTVGRLYLVTVSSGRYLFSTPTRVFELNANVTNADFVAEP
ncbi:MAG: carboxypeptidase-like regulatory domain-containing protein [Pyrinomonadaceae bacterium]